MNTLTFTIPAPQPDDELQDVIDLAFADAFRDAFGDDDDIPDDVFFQEVDDFEYRAEW
jgi:hypothetical protein